MLILECDHPFCKECIKQSIAVKIDSGDSFQFNFPECDMFIGRDILGRLLTDAEFVRYTKTVKKQSIAAKHDLNAHLAICLSCSFNFCDCDNCNIVWHSGDCEKVDAIKRPENQPKQIQPIAKNKGRQFKRKLDNSKAIEAKSEQFKKDFCQKCPCCKSWIEKTAETFCSQIHCIICSTDFCYACGKLPKDHEFHYGIQGFYCGHTDT